MDSASQIAAASQAPAQPIAANSEICRPSRKKKFGARTVVGNFKQQMLKALHQRKGQERKEAGMRRPSVASRKKKEADANEKEKPKPMRRPSVARRKKEDKAKDFWLFLVSLKDDLFVENEEASALYHMQFLISVFDRSRAKKMTIIASFYEYINAFVVKLTTEQSKILQERAEVEYVKDWNIRGYRRDTYAPYAHLFPPFAQSSSPKPPHLVDENMDSDVNRSPGNEENCKTKMVTTDDKPLPLPETKLFLVGLNAKPLLDKFEEDLNDEEAAILRDIKIKDDNQACLVYHKKFLKKTFGSLASGLAVVRSYSRFLLNAFVVEVVDTEAEKWHGWFKALAEVEYVREVKKREERSKSAISTSALPKSLSVEL